MHRRVLLAIGTLVILVALTGCMGFGSSTSESGLAEEATYDWDTEAGVTIDLDSGSYTAVIHLEEQDQLRLYQSTRYGTEHPIGVRAVQFRYPNGTVVNSSEIEVEETRNSVYLTLPHENGTVAYTASKQSKQFSMPVLAEGDWEVIVPEGHRVDNMILGTVRPGGSETEIIDDRVHITWTDLSSSSIRVEYYLARDVYLFGGLLAVVAVVGMVGIGYVYRQILELRRKRSELGLDLDIDEDDIDDRGPPPGRR